MPTSDRHCPDVERDLREVIHTMTYEASRNIKSKFDKDLRVVPFGRH